MVLVTCVKYSSPIKQPRMIKTTVLLIGPKDRPFFVKDTLFWLRRILRPLRLAATELEYVIFFVLLGPHPRLSFRDRRVGLIPVKIKLVYDPYGHSSGTGIFVLYLNRHETFLALSIFYFYYGSQFRTTGTRI